MIRKTNDLGRKLYSFAVISDTHVNPDENVCNSPFPVNARANRRFRHLIGDLNRRNITFVMHLGDLLHPVPETGALYAQAANAYREIVSELSVPIHHVPGNHDIGDTPIKGGPASPTTEAMIAAWQAEFGAQYQKVEYDGVTFLLLNAQLINSGLHDETVQRDWVERELASTSGRVMVMLHHPVYLCAPDEPNHYDNTDAPGRDWILEQLKLHKIEAMFSGHAHNFWYDRIGETDYYLAPASSFVRQDYAEMSRIPPPEGSEFGRDDRAKLGYFLVDVHEHGHVLQVIRTYGAERASGEVAQPASLVALPPRANPSPRIGFDLRQNWAEICEVPPSGGLDEFDRKLVRNDYPLMALIEMGVRDIRIPLADLRDQQRRSRLKALCHLGFRPTLFSYGIPSSLDLALIQQSRDKIADWEMAVDWSDLTDLRPQIARVHQITGLPIFLSRMRSKADLVADSVFFHVINHGFTVDDPLLDDLRVLADAGVIGAVFRLSAQMPIKKTLRSINARVCDLEIRASVHLRISGDNPAIAEEAPVVSQSRMTEAMTIAPSLMATRVWCDTLVDNDRGYFPRQGAIDRCGNPNSLLDKVRQAHRG